MGNIYHVSCLTVRLLNCPLTSNGSMAHFFKIPTYHHGHQVHKEGLEVLQLTENTNITIHHWNVILEAGEYCVSAFQVYKYKHKYRLHKNKDLIAHSMSNPLSDWFRVLTSKTAMMIRNKS